MLFVRRDAFPAGAVPITKDRIWPQVLAETDGVDGPRAHFARGVAFFKMHRFDLAAPEFAAHREAFPEDRESAELGNLLESSLRGDGAATAALEELYRRGRGN